MLFFVTVVVAFAIVVDVVVVFVVSLVVIFLIVVVVVVLVIIVIVIVLVVVVVAVVVVVVFVVVVLIVVFVVLVYCSGAESTRLLFSVFEYTYLIFWNVFWSLAPVIAIGLFDRNIGKLSFAFLLDIYLTR